jgi:hypothetical protein
MCHKLVQTYACSRSEDICTTPCPHALALSSARVTAESTFISRSNSTVSSIAHSSRQHATNSPASSLLEMSPLPRVTTQPGVSSQRGVSPKAKASLLAVSLQPAYRFRLHNPPATPLSLVSTSHLDAALFDHAAGTQPVQSVYCPYFFPRHLMPSRYPCRECYMQPEWEGMRRAWVENYQLGHPMDKVEDVERLAGVKM